MLIRKYGSVYSKDCENLEDANFDGELSRSVSILTSSPVVVNELDKASIRDSSVGFKVGLIISVSLSLQLYLLKPGATPATALLFVSPS